MKGFLDEAANQNHPLRTLKEFLNLEHMSLDPLNSLPIEFNPIGRYPGEMVL